MFGKGMHSLINDIQRLNSSSCTYPFAIYSAQQEQKLLNVPINNPVLIFVLSGAKALGPELTVECSTGSFVMLPGNAAINMRNIPKQSAYYAVLLEFSYEDFDVLPAGEQGQPEMVIGDIEKPLSQWLHQFINYLSWAPEVLWEQRKREVLPLLFHLGHTDILKLRAEPTLSQQLHGLFVENAFSDVSAQSLCDQLAMSESTLRRRLASEGASLQSVRDKARMGMGLHLLQTSQDSIQRVAEQCGYQSQSRFTDRFKKHFGLTPSELRKTRLTE